MALDTYAKRGGAVNLGSPWRTWAVLPSGGIDTVSERISLLYLDGAVYQEATGTGSAEFSFTVSGVGILPGTGVGTSTFTMTATAAGLADKTGAGASSFTFTASGVPSVSGTGTGLAEFSFTVIGIPYGLVDPWTDTGTYEVPTTMGTFAVSSTIGTFENV